MDMKRADLPLLLSLDVLLEELNVSRAAKRVHISQSALSGQLARLREAFGDPLLVPSENGRGMVPTEFAMTLKPRLAEALALLREAVTQPQAFDPLSSDRTFVVAANDSVFTMLGMDVMATVMRLGNPRLRIAVVPSADINLVDQMARGAVDLFLGDQAKVPAVLKARHLLSADFALAQRHGHPRGKGAPDLDEYCALPHVVVSSRADFTTPVDDLVASLGQQRTVVAAVTSYNQIALILSQTDGVATLPRQLLQRYVNLVDLIELPMEIPQFKLAMAWHPRSQNDKAAAWLRDCFVSTCRPSDAA